jgi:putative ABC transport system substrate-binding protein
MRRRDFITLVAGTAAGWPLRARAQQSKALPRVGVLWHAGSAEEEAIYLGEFLEGLRALGYVDGKTILLEHRFPNEMPERFTALGAELAALKPDVLVAVTRPAALAVQHATKIIPTVFIVVPDPVGTRLVDSLARPGGNITGLTHIAAELSAKRLEIFKEIFPAATRVALLVNANDEQGMRRYIDESQSAALKFGVAVRPVEVRALGEFEQAFDMIVVERLEGVLLPADGLSYQGRELLAQAALKRHLPLIVYSRETLEAGALVSYGTDVRAVFRRAANYIDKILKGEKPADLPVEQPTRFETLVNLKTAKALGVTIPDVTLLRASEVIE